MNSTFEQSGLRQNRDDEVANVNMTPLIDVILFLLFFFVLTTNFNRLSGIDVTKPKAQTAQTQGQKVMMIGISREGTVHVYGRQVPVERLRSLVDNEVSKRPDLSVVIIADQEASVGRTVEVMDQCNLGGALKVSVAAEKK
jgi:biopolymer transport protein ExbD